MNPEQIKQEQERVQTLLKGVTEGEWYAYTHFHGTAIYSPRTPGPQERFEPDEHPIHVIAENAGSVDGALMAESQRLARAYLALLDAHLALHAQLAQVGEREKALREERDAYRKGLTTLINVHVNVPSAGDMRDMWERNAWKHAEGIVAQYGCDSCAGLTFEDGSIACWTCGRVLPDAQAGEG